MYYTIIFCILKWNFNNHLLFLCSFFRSGVWKENGMTHELAIRDEVRCWYLGPDDLAVGCPLFWNGRSLSSLRLCLSRHWHVNNVHLLICTLMSELQDILYYEMKDFCSLGHEYLLLKIITEILQ